MENTVPLLSDSKRKNWMLAVVGEMGPGDVCAPGLTWGDRRMLKCVTEVLREAGRGPQIQTAGGGGTLEALKRGSVDQQFYSMPQ